MTLIQQFDAPQDIVTERLCTRSGITLSYDKFGRGPPLVLVHGSFTDHRSNWQFVADALAQNFTIYALARRGRGDTDATQDHSMEDEAEDVGALIREIDAPVVLLGHSYGAQVALAAARAMSSRIEKLVLYEPPGKHIVTGETSARLEELARAGDWDGFTTTFFRDVISLPEDELEELRQSPLWAQTVADAACTLHDMRAQRRYDFDARRFAELHLPVTLQIGTESPRSLYGTDALMAVLPDARVQELPGQGHDAMLTDPAMYVRQVLQDLTT